MRRLYIPIAALALVASAAAAQEPRVSMEFRPFVGAFVPMGDQSNDFKSATTLGTQGAVELNNNWHLVGQLAWTHGHNKLGLSEDLTYIWQYNLGTELNAFYAMSNGFLFRPFVGLGGGMRTYDYQITGMDSKSCTEGYGALGGELQKSAFALRFETRDYLNCFESPFTGKKSSRNDMSFSIGVALHAW